MAILNENNSSIDHSTTDQPGNRIVVLDRDGVINHDSDAYVKTVDEWIPIDGSIEAIALLKQHGYQVFIATNQSGIGRGYYTEDTLHAMHAKMQTLLDAYDCRIDGIFYCPHHPDEICDCRKPLPGLIDHIEQSIGTSVSGGVMVGDSLRDLEAGIAKGLKPILVKTGKGERTLQKPLPKDTAVFDDLLSWVQKL